MRLMGIKIYLKRRYRDKMRKTFLILQIHLNEIKESQVLTNERLFEDKHENKRSDSIIKKNENSQYETLKL